MLADVPMPDQSERNGSDFPEISDHALIGDCRTAALVTRNGSIDWLCLPHFSSPSVFARLLDPERGGFCAISPSHAFVTSRSYIEGSATLETVFETDGGVAVLRDVIPILDGIAPLQPMREVLRIVEGRSGDVEFDIVIDVQPDYGRKKPAMRERGKLGWACVWGNEILNVGTNATLRLEAGRLVGRFKVGSGEKQYLSLSYTKGDPAIVPMLGEAADQRLDQTVRWWREWIAQSTYRGPFREMVERSAIILKLMHFSLSGAIIAAPTTSLPELIGGSKNWDYRYCWLRDAGLTMQALVGLGYHVDGQLFLSWLLHSTRLTRPKLQVMYDIYGRTDLAEKTLEHWRGYRDSRPVRIGNGAYAQSQLDTYGEVIMAADAFVTAGNVLDHSKKQLLIGLGGTVCSDWREPDSGIWESRGKPRHYTYSKVMCWVALDRLISLHERGVLELGKREPEFRRERDAIRTAVEADGFNSTIESYTDVFNGDKVDASLLLLVCSGYRAGSHPRMKATHDRIRDRLDAGAGRLFRHEPKAGDPPAEGAFGICSFWSIDNFVDRGELDAAERLFKTVAAFANDVGLFAEEFEPSTGAALGNFPQAFTHVGFINAALAIEQARRKEKPS